MKRKSLSKQATCGNVSALNAKCSLHASHCARYVTDGASLVRFGLGSSMSIILCPLLKQDYQVSYLDEGKSILNPSSCISWY